MKKWKIVGYTIIVSWIVAVLNALYFDIGFVYSIMGITLMFSTIPAAIILIKREENKPWF